MEFIRVFLLSILIFLGFLLFGIWQKEYPSQKLDTVNHWSSLDTKGDGLLTEKKNDSEASKSLFSGVREISVKTDILGVTIDRMGGDLVQAQLLRYIDDYSGAEGSPFKLLDRSNQRYYVAKSELVRKGGVNSIGSEPVYSSDASTYQLRSDQDHLVVDLYWEGNGVTLHKQYVFKRGSYVVGVFYRIENQRQDVWEGYLSTQLQRRKTPAEGGFFSSYVGGSISSDLKPYEKISFDKMTHSSVDKKTKDGWIAMQEHYFLGAWIPNPGQLFHIYSGETDGIYYLGMRGSDVIVNPGHQATVGAKLYLGPKIIDCLKAAAPHLNLTVDYGFCWFISLGLFWLLKQVFQWIGNWGWSIVIVTTLIKLVFYWPSARSYRSMANIRKLQPRLQRLKELYKDDPQKLARETLHLWRKEKANPLGGCLPMLIQIPVFFALYSVLLESVELWHAPFIFWIHDLSSKDPYYILPVLMGLVMFIQQSFSPTSDSTQANLMKFFPLFFTVFFLNFPSGLVLYWVVNTALSLLQQWYINFQTGVEI